MLPDPSELKALDKAIEAFDEAYLNLKQCARRIQRIYELDMAPPRKHHDMSRPEEQRKINMSTEVSGNFCPKCQSLHVRIKGAGCLMCLDCCFHLGF